MRILNYRGLDLAVIHKKYEKIIRMLEQNDFHSAEVKKLLGTPYYRAKLDHSNRLLFTMISYQSNKYILILEVINNHNYEQSRFLNGAKIDLGKIEEQPVDLNKQPIESVSYINPSNPYIHILDRIISLDPEQSQIFDLQPPLIIIGSAGSGKTLLTLEKIKTYPGHILYATASSYLAQNSRNLYYANNYINDDQEVEFLSYQEFLATIKVTSGKEIEFYVFANWVAKFYQHKAARDPNKLYEEFKGVITGNGESNYLTKEQYLNLGIKQSIYNPEERHEVYNLFNKYLEFLSTYKLYDSNLLAFEYLSLCRPKYDLVVVDEVQDLSRVQLLLILKSCLYAEQFILCGDANQIVHPNFFSWSNVKSFFHKQDYCTTNLTRILHKSYRNAIAIIDLANKILKCKQERFGSIDQESNYLIEHHSTEPGEIYCILHSSNILAELNNKTRKSTKFAVIVLREQQKEEAKLYFNTPLVFSIYEAKGLEYENVILYNLITAEAKNFAEISKGICSKDLEGDLIYKRTKDKTDHSLDVYKFYINALYVAVTRAIRNIYFIEKEPHPLLELLALQPTTELRSINIQESSIADWQKEMHRLELQGKQLQVEAIKSTILISKDVPWKVMSSKDLSQLKAKALDFNSPDKKARLLLLEHALVYNDQNLLSSLQELSFMPALKIQKSMGLLERAYFMGYTGSNYTLVIREIDKYGVDFRNQFNQTPLMVASYFGNFNLIKELLERGSNLRLTDNYGHNAWQIALRQAFNNPNFAKKKLPTIYSLLNPGEINLQINNQLVKLGNQHMEFFLVNAIIVMLKSKKQQNIAPFKVNSFLLPLQNFPDSIIPARRKQRTYISSILAKNEIYRQDPYNRQLFVRVKLGCYILNPELQIETLDGWQNIYNFLNLEQISTYYQNIVEHNKFGASDDLKEQNIVEQNEFRKLLMINKDNY